MNLKKIIDSASLSQYSESDLDMYPKSDIRKVAKALGLTDVEAASWAIGPNFVDYSDADMDKGEEAAEKFLGKELFDELDPTSSDSFDAVLDKINASKKPKSTKKSYNEILKNNKYVQKAIDKGWKVLKPLKGHDEVVLAAPDGYKVRAFSGNRAGDYVWGGINEDGSYNKYSSKYDARSLYEKQAKELNKNK